jgi:S1-C subfamily serine protease
MAQETAGLAAFSGELATIVERTAASVVRVDDGSRLTATGVIWSADGLILTTSHGTERDDELFVEFGDGSRHAAALVGRDGETDFALLKVEATGLPAIERGDDEGVRIGSLVLTVARPGNFGLSATLGIVSSKTASQRGGRNEMILHTDAGFHFGFSGSPLVDMSGKMIGVANLAFGRGKSVALGVSIATHTAELLQAHGTTRRGYLGIRTQLVPLPDSLRTALALKQANGLLVFATEQGSAAESAGLLIGDTLLAINGQALSDVDDLRRVLRSMRAGETITLTLLRGGAIQPLVVTLG